MGSVFSRELCDGLHSNVYLTQLELRLAGNQLEAFIHEYAARFASIPSLTALDLTGCGKEKSILSGRWLVLLELEFYFYQLRVLSFQSRLTCLV